MSYSEDRNKYLENLNLAVMLDLTTRCHKYANIQISFDILTHNFGEISFSEFFCKMVIKMLSLSVPEKI